VYGKERKKNRKVKKIIIYVYERMKGRRRIKREKRSGKKDLREMNQVKRNNKSARKDVTLLRDETFTLFPTMCNPTTRTSSVPRSHIFFCPLHMSTILNLLTLDIPTYGLILMIIGFER
jgi:hypothetical protein